MKDKNTEKKIKKNIKLYKLPLYKRIAYIYPFFKFFIFFIIKVLITLILFKNVKKDYLIMIILISLIISVALSLYNLTKFMFYHLKYKNWYNSQGESDNHSVIYAGAPGTGKTLTSMFSAVAMADYSWAELRFEYWLIINKNKKEENLTPHEKEIIEAYNFYINNPGIPCLATNVGMYDYRYKRYSYIYETEHLKLQSRLPYRICGVIDELSTTCSTDLKNDKTRNDYGSADISDHMKYCRHFLEERLIGCEQDLNNVFIDFRRVVAENRVYYKKTWTFKPIILLWFYNIFKKHIIKHINHYKSSFFKKFMVNFKNFINSVGFQKFNYKIVGNTETGICSVDKTKSNSNYEISDKSFYLVLPKAMPFKYDTRAFASAYKPLEEEIDLKCYNSIYMSRDRASKNLKSNNIIKKINKKND